MYPGLLHSHSVVRYFVLILLVVVIIMSLVGLINKKPYGAMDNRIGLFLFISTHIQLLLGIILYFVSPFVQFSGGAMKDPGTRYWLVEHSTAMLVAVALITVARTTSKKMTRDEDKHKRMLIFNSLALLIILVIIWHSGRGIV
jgi:uncharacterized membrane protein